MNVISTPCAMKTPSGKLDIPSAWQGAEMKANPDRWLRSLTSGEIAELAREADLGLLLDVNNVLVSAKNHGFDPEIVR